MEDLTSNWLWYGELRPLSGPGARRQWSPERTEAEKTGINAVAVKAAVKCGEQGQWGGGCALMHCVCRNRPDPVFLLHPKVRFCGLEESTPPSFRKAFLPRPPTLLPPPLIALLASPLISGLAVHDLTGLGGGQATAPFRVLWFYPLDQAGLRLRTEVSSSS